MLMPWQKVYAQTHLTGEGIWEKATPPFPNFFTQCSSVPFYRDKETNLTIRARFSRNHHYRVWREWIPFVGLPILNHTITLYSTKQFGYRSADGIPRVGKSFEIALTPIEVEQLERLDFLDLPIGLTMRLSRDLVHH